MFNNPILPGTIHNSSSSTASSTRQGQPTARINRQWHFWPSITTITTETPLNIDTNAQAGKRTENLHTPHNNRVDMALLTPYLEPIDKSTSIDFNALKGLGDRIQSAYGGSYQIREDFPNTHITAYFRRYGDYQENELRLGLFVETNYHSRQQIITITDTASWKDYINKASDHYQFDEQIGLSYVFGIFTI